MAGANTTSTPSRSHSSRSASKRARVAVKVFVGPNCNGLTKIDVTTRPPGRPRGRAHQAGVTLVESAHGRDEGDPPVAAACVGEQDASSARVLATEGRVILRCASGSRRPPRRAASGSERADRQHPAVGDARSRVARAIATYVGSVSGALRRTSAQVVADRLDVAAHDRAGQRGVALVERVVEGGRSSGRSVSAGWSSRPRESSSIASVTSVTRWLAPWASPAW